MEKGNLSLRNYAYIGDSVWEIFVRNYTILQTSNPKILHKITTDRVNASFQRDMLFLIEDKLNPEEQEIARAARNLSIPVGRKKIQADYRLATAFETLIGYWYINDKSRLDEFLNIFKDTEFFN